MAQPSQKTLFDNEYDAKLERFKNFYLRPLTRLSPTLERSFLKVLSDFHAGRPANACVLELAEKEKIPYELAGIMMLARAFPNSNAMG